MRKLMILIFLALAIAALPLIGTTAEDGTGDVEGAFANSDATAASGCEKISLGSFGDEDIDADVGYDEGLDDAEMLSDFNDYSMQEEAGDVTEMELLCEPPNPDNTVICYDGDTPLNCNIVGDQYVCP